MLVGIVAVLTVAFVASAVSGVAKGIQWLSNINMVLAVHPGALRLRRRARPCSSSTWSRPRSATTAATWPRCPPAPSAGGDAMPTWLSGWTIFYWAWWISWTPFVGMFIARISRGRTIRQFVTGVLLVPSVVSLIWFAIFGGAAIKQQRDGVDISRAGEHRGAALRAARAVPAGAVAASW